MTKSENKKQLSAEPLKHYVMMAQDKYLTLDPVTWTWHLSDHLEDLKIWDYHHDLICMPLPEIGQSVRYVELSSEQLALIEGNKKEKGLSLRESKSEAA